MKNVGITPDEWNALAAGRTVTLGRVPGERKGEFAWAQMSYEEGDTK